MRKLMNKHTSQSFATWRAFTDEQLKIRRITKKAIATWTQHKRKLAITKLRDFAQNRKYLRGKMTLAFERRFYRDKTLFFNEWKGYTAWQIECREKLHKFALILQNRHFYSWRKAALEQIDERMRMERAGVFWIKRTERQAWVQWLVFLDQRRAIRRAVAFLRNHRMASAFNAYVHGVEMTKRESAAELMLKRLKNREVAKVMDAWKEVTEWEARMRRLGRIAIVKAQRSAKTYIFAKWRARVDLLLACKGLLDRTMKEDRRIRFRQWKKNARRQAQLNRAASVVRAKWVT